MNHIGTRKFSAKYKKFLIQIKKRKQEKDKKVLAAMNITKKLEKIENFLITKLLPIYQSHNAEYQVTTLCYSKIFYMFP